MKRISINYVLRDHNKGITHLLMSVYTYITFMVWPHPQHFLLFTQVLQSSLKIHLIVTPVIFQLSHLSVSSGFTMCKNVI